MPAIPNLTTVSTPKVGVSSISVTSILCSSISKFPVGEQSSDALLLKRSFKCSVETSLASLSLNHFLSLIEILL